MYKVGFKEAEEPEIKLSTLVGSWNKQASSRKTSTSTSLCGSQSNRLRKFLRRCECQTTLSVSWESCMRVKEQQLGLGWEQQTGSKLGKEYNKAVYYHPVHLTSMYAKCQAGLSQAGINMARRNINNIRYSDDTTLMAESKEELKCLLMKVKEESEKAVLKLNFQKMKIMASGSITSWQIDGEKMETVTDFLGLQNHGRW